MDLIAHRGCGEQYPENTVGAVERASSYVETVEIDVRRCDSGELVVFHDGRLERLTDGQGRVANASLAELRSLEVLDSGEPVPLLAEVLAAFPPGVTAQVELKETGIATDVLDGLAGFQNDATVTSFLPDALAEVGDRDPTVPTGLLFESDPFERLETAAALGCEAVHPHYDLCLDTDVVAAAHDRGIRVVAWKAARTPGEVAALKEAGVDGVTADRWDIA